MRWRNPKAPFSSVLRSRAFVLALLVVLAVLLAGRSVLPLRFWTSSLLAVLAALFLSLASCTAVQFRSAAARFASLSTSAASLALSCTTTLSWPASADLAQVLEQAAQLLRDFGYRPLPVPAPFTGLRAAKHTAGWWGSPVFHFGLLLLLLAAALISLTQTWGRTVLVEGETFTDRRVEYLVFRQGPWASFHPFRVKFRLDRVEATYRPDGQVEDFASAVTLLGQEGRAVAATSIAGGHPLRQGEVTVYRNVFGYAPVVRFAVQNSQERPAPLPFGPRPTLVVLDTLGLSGEGEKYTGSFVEPTSQKKVSFTFLPDYDSTAGRGMSKAPKRPTLLVTVGQDALARQGVLPLGQSLTLAGLSMDFLGYRRWASFTVVSCRGVSLLWAGFLLSLTGAALLYLLNPRWVQLTLSPEGQLCLQGGSRRAPQLLAEDLSRLAERLGARKPESEEGSS